MLVIHATQHKDERGGFTRLFSEPDIRDAGVAFSAIQTNLSTNWARGTLRGLHFQYPPHAEAKLVQVVEGAIFDVAVDLRPGDTFGQWLGIELTAEDTKAVYLPEGVAHGFITLQDNSSVLYHMGRAYEGGHAQGIYWGDSDIGIEWPIAPVTMSEADRNWPLLKQHLPKLHNVRAQ